MGSRWNGSCLHSVGSYWIVWNAQCLGKDERIVPRFVDKPFHWVAILALASGAAVLVPSLAALGMTLVAVILDLV